MAQDKSVAPATLPADFNQWDTAPDTLPAEPRLPQEADTGFLAGAERGAEKFAQGAKATVKGLSTPPSEGPIESIVGAAKQIPGALKSIPAMVDKADQQYQTDPGGFIGEGLTGAVIPQIAGSMLFKGASALTSAADEKAAELTGKAGFSEDAKAAYLQSRAEAVKQHLTTVKVAAQKDLNQRAASVIGTIDKTPGAISRTEVRANMMDVFGDDPSAAPTDVSRIISSENGTDMSFGQLHDLNQKIFQAKLSAKGADKAALNEAYAKNAQMLDKVAQANNQGDQWNTALMDFRQFYKDWGGKSNLTKAANAEDYRRIMNPLDSPTTAQKLARYKQAGADPAAVATEQKAYRLAQAKGNSLGWHGIAPHSALEAAGGVAGYGAGSMVGSVVGHPYIGGAVGARAGVELGRKVGTSPMMADWKYPSTLPPVE